MDVVAQRLASLLASFVLIFIMGCTSAPEEKLIAASYDCLPAVAPGRYILHNQDGSVELVTAASADEVINKFIVPRGESLKYVTHDFVVREDQNNRATEFAIPDNWGAGAINAPAIWAHGVYGEGVTVAVVDSGVDVTHSSLAANIFSNPGETGNDGNGNARAHNGVDDDFNGLIDDAHGYNFADEIAGVVDETGHGTHIAGVIAGAHSDTSVQTGYVQGVAPQAKIMPVDFMRNGSGYIYDGLTAIKYAAGMGAKVINASWGGMSCMPEMATIVSDLAQQGVLFVSAAGNENTNIDFYPSYPAALKAPSQISVGAIGWGNFKAEFSNYGDEAVNIFAPGVGIVSSVPSGNESMNGTSMAAPFVAGAAAALWGLNGAPSADVMTIRDYVLRSVVKSNEYRNSTRGRLDLEKSLPLLGY